MCIVRLIQLTQFLPCESPDWLCFVSIHSGGLVLSDCRCLGAHAQARYTVVCLCVCVCVCVCRLLQLLKDQ